MLVNRRETMALGAAIGGAALSGAHSAKAAASEPASWSDVAKAFPRSTDKINLLHTGGGDCTTNTLNTLARYQTIAAATGVDSDEVLAAMKESGSSAALRARMASTFGCGADEIALTRNAMEGLAIGLLGVDLKPGDEVITTRSDYDSCLKILYQRQARDEISVKLIDIPMGADNDEAIVSAFEEAITPRTRLISMCHMHNKSGQIIPVRKIADLAR
ncbi:MAG: aminotransferase class V-fold PLP-dependent enzyme, partial [Pseudomonadota bacterium]